MLFRRKLKEDRRGLKEIQVIGKNDFVNIKKDKIKNFFNSNNNE